MNFKEYLEEKTNKKHELIITSLHDAQAKCSEGDWEFIRTGEATKEEIEKMFDTHLKNVKKVTKKEA